MVPFKAQHTHMLLLMAPVYTSVLLQLNTVPILAVTQSHYPLLVTVTHTRSSLYPHTCNVFSSLAVLLELLDPEDEGTMILWCGRKYLPNDSSSHSRRLKPYLDCYVYCVCRTRGAQFWHQIVLSCLVLLHKAFPQVWSAAAGFMQIWIDIVAFRMNPGMLTSS